MANEVCVGCSLYKNDSCKKYRKNGKCDPSTRDWLTSPDYVDPIEFIPVDRMCEKSSIFGNCYVGLTLDDIERIKKGEIVTLDCEEYGIFIGLSGDAECQP